MRDTFVDEDISHPEKKQSPRQSESSHPVKKSSHPVKSEFPPYMGGQVDSISCKGFSVRQMHFRTLSTLKIGLIGQVLSFF
jgi:hypothetical protein